MVNDANKDMRLRQAIGQADLCELMAASFSFPDEALSGALADGSFARDVQACLADAGAGGAALTAVEKELTSLVGRDPEELLGTLRKGYSLLYLVPGANVPVFPYEGAFRYVAEGREGAPTLFRSPVTLDVERCMREAGVVPRDVRKEPCDSVFEECEFMAYLLACRAEAIRCDDPSAEAVWTDRYRAFSAQHAGQWLPAFMAKTRQVSESAEGGKEYAALAFFAERALKLLPEER